MIRISVLLVYAGVFALHTNKRQFEVQEFDVEQTNDPNKKQKSEESQPVINNDFQQWSIASDGQQIRMHAATGNIQALLILTATGAVGPMEHLLATFYSECHEGKHSLLHAVQHNNLPFIKVLVLLVTLMPSPNIFHFISKRDKFGANAIIYAAAGGYLELVKYLCEIKYSCSNEEYIREFLLVKDRKGRNAISYALANKHAGVYEYLKAHQLEFIKLMIAFGKLDLVQELAGCTMTLRGLIHNVDTRLNHALMVQFGWDLFKDGESILIQACKHGQMKILHSVFQLVVAAVKSMPNKHDIFFKFLTHQDKVGKTGIIHAAEHGHFDCVRIIFRIFSLFYDEEKHKNHAWCLLNHRDINGMTALIHSAKNGHEKVYDFFRRIKETDRAAIDKDGLNAETHWAKWCILHADVDDLILEQFQQEGDIAQEKLDASIENINEEKQKDVQIEENNGIFDPDSFLNL